ncbi:MAG: chromosome segregation protein SMC [Robiginitomaculum sp.]
MESLRFNQIKLVGFKSFVEPTVFQIKRGLTGVVGPNGCGKSNLLEAIRWVMGANSAKAMRGAAMDDVIFNGTKTRPGRNQASVILTIDNKARIAPPMFNDDEVLEITRIITKGLGSKYRVNGKITRAKDIQLLFADASTGANSPALVRQGQINELISAKPANRRRILEEAAGISGLHSRRHEAELRLRAAETNLDRLEDVLGQIESQLLSLRRQSRQANRYKKLAGLIREYKALLWLKRWEQALKSVTDNRQALKDAEGKVAGLTGTVTKLTTQVSEISTRLDPLREEQIVAAAVCGRLNAAKEALENDEQAAKGEIKKLEARLAFLKGDIEREENIARDAKTAGEKLAKELSGLKAIKDISAALTTARQETEKAVNTRTEIETKLSKLNRKSAQQAALQSGAQREYDNLFARHARLETDVSDVAVKKLNLLDQSEIGKNQNLFAASLTNTLHALERARADEQKALTAKADAENKERILRDILSTAEQALSEVEAEARALGNVINNTRANIEWSPALDSLTVKAGYETALAAAFGDDLEAGLEKNAPLRWDGAKKPVLNLPKGAQSLAGLVKAPKALDARLSQIGVIDKKAGDTLASQLKPGQRLVSIEGDLWRWDGFRASSEIPSSAALKLENVNRLAKIEDKIPTLTQATKAAEAAYSSAKEKRSDTDSAAQDARQVLPALERAERKARSSLSQFETDQARTSAQLVALTEQEERLGAERHEVCNLLKQSKEVLAGLYVDADLDSQIEALSAELSQAREAADEAGGQYRSLENEAQARTERLRAVEQEIKDWSVRGAHALERITSLEGREAETNMALTRAKDSPDEFEARQQTLLTELSTAENRARTASDALSGVENALRETDANLRAAEQTLGTAREERAAAIARDTASQERQQEVSARIAETLSCEPNELKQQLEDLSPDSKMAEGDIERKLERLTRERENMGGVNLRADEEAREQEEQLLTLKEERQDLVGAIARLREGIDDLNAEGREKLLKAFDTVNGHFGRLFTTLFSGGHASLALTQSDDPLEAGLEVMVSPPGKKLASMSLMSGGEQALTATALIFAVFLSNPAPICVLDEVDAPLDDANVERYCDLLDEMCKSTPTKFIAITHNPVTMARMDRLFGVTMAEKGVSQIVSIDLQKAEKLTA